MKLSNYQLFLDANSAVVEKELTSELVVIPIVSPSSSYGGACNTNFDIFGAKLMQYTVLYDWIASKWSQWCGSKFLLKQSFQYR